MVADQHLVDEAYQLLEALRDASLPNRPLYLHPYTLLTALLQHAPASDGKAEIAKDILTQTSDELVDRLTKLSDYFFSNLLLPRIPLQPLCADINNAFSGRKNTDSIGTSLPTRGVA